MNRKFFVLSCILASLFMVTALSGCNGNQGGNAADQTPPYSYESAQDIGQGDTVFRFELIDDENALTVWYVHTDETTVGDALLAVGLIEGDVSAFGLFVTKVNGQRADFNADGTWWAFYINGEFAVTGVDRTYIEPGMVYGFVFTR